MRVYLIRHAESLANVDKEVYHTTPDYDIPLTKKGEKDAIKLGKQYPLLIIADAIYCSPYKRARQTAELAKFTSCFENPLLREREWGSLREEIESSEFDASKHFNFYYRPQNGESFADLYQRVITFFNMLKVTHDDDEKIVVVTHGEWIKMALMYYFNHTVDYIEKNHTNVKNCEVVTIKL